MRSKLSIHLHLPALLVCMGLVFGIPALAQTKDDAPNRVTKKVGESTVTFHFARPAVQPKIRVGKDLEKVLEARVDGLETPPAREVSTKALTNGMTSADLPAHLFETVAMRYDAEGNSAQVCTSAGAMDATKLASRQEGE